MPDPLTHLCTALLPKAIFGGRHTGVFAVGVSLPDMGSRLPSMALDRLIHAGLPLPEWTMYPWSVLHTPIGASLACALLTWMFPERDRPAVLAWMGGGAALHLAADLTQHHHGKGYMLLAPFSTWRFELGWIGSEATVPLAPWIALLTISAWGFRLWLERRRAPAAQA